MATQRSASVTWNGGLLDGSGVIHTSTSGALGSLPVSWPARSQEPDGKTSPEELIAAAHAACFSMALSNVLAEGGTPPEELAVNATVTFVPGTGITTSMLDVEGRVPGVDAETFLVKAQDAKANCPVSQALKGIEIGLTAKLA